MKRLAQTLIAILFSLNGQAGFAMPDHLSEQKPSTVKDYLVSAKQRQSAGLYKEAEELLLVARSMASKEVNVTQQVNVLSSLGDLYLVTDRISRAEQVLHEAEQLAVRNTLKSLLVGIYINKGNVYNHQGETEKALEVYKQGADMASGLGDTKQSIVALINYSRALINNKKHKEALKSFDDLSALIEKQDASVETAFQLSSIARLAQDLLEAGSPGFDKKRLKSRIVGLYDKASLMAEQTGDLYIASYAYGSLASLYQKEKRLEEAGKLLQRASFLARQVEADELFYRWKWSLARLYRDQGDAQAAIKAFREAIVALQRVRPHLTKGARAVTKSFSESSGQLYFEMADLLLQQPESTLPEIERKQQLVEARQTVELMKAVELQDYFKDNCVTALRTRTTGIDQLDPHTAVLYIIPLKDRIELLLSLPESMEQITVPVSDQTLRTEIDHFRHNLEIRTTRRYLKQARQLYDWLIRPIADVLERSEITTLVTVPQGALMGIPLAALHDGNQFLVEQFALATTPGLALTEPKALQKENTKILLAGISESVQGFPALPNVTEELAAISGIFDSQVFRNAEFSRTNINNAMQGVPYPIVHIASHAQFKGRSEDTFLLTHEEKMDLDTLEQLIGISEFRDVPVELLTLSACQTAAGNDQSALGLAGIAIKAGARSALASLWFVSDLSTSRLMTHFYQNLEQPDISKAQALQKAQIAVLKDRRFRHPAYWAPFLLIGNWL